MKRMLIVVALALAMPSFALTHKMGKKVATNKTVGTAALNGAQQVGATCVATPQCPDCDGRGNVCLSAREFFPGLTVLAAKRYMVQKCRQANALDYCGGSRGCMKKSRDEQNRHRARYGGGCYKQCETAIHCYIDNRWLRKPGFRLSRATQALPIATLAAL